MGILRASAALVTRSSRSGNIALLLKTSLARGTASCTPAMIASRSFRRVGSPPEMTTTLSARKRGSCSVPTISRGESRSLAGGLRQMSQKLQRLGHSPVASSQRNSGSSLPQKPSPIAGGKEIGELSATFLATETRRRSSIMPDRQPPPSNGPLPPKELESDRLEYLDVLPAHTESSAATAI